MWFEHIKSAFWRHLLFKGIGITFFISIFFVAYFHILKNPAFPTTVIPFTYFDHIIGFQPLALPLYLSLWLYVATPPVLIAKRKELYEYTFSIGIMSMIGLAIFYFWPTTIPLSNINWDQYPSIDFLKNIDAAGNACPSLHVATAVFSGFWLDYLLLRFKTPQYLRIINLVWCVGIIYSTIATRQHVTLDVLGGLILASVAIIIARAKFWKT